MTKESVTDGVVVGVRVGVGVGGHNDSLEGGGGDGLGEGRREEGDLEN